MLNNKTNFFTKFINSFFFKQFNATINIFSLKKKLYENLIN